MALSENENTKALLEKLSMGSINAYTVLFHRYYKDLVLFAGTLIQDRAVCEDIVQNIFIRLWNEHEHLSISTSLKVYLISATRNGCLDYLRHLEVRKQYAKSILPQNFHSVQETEKYILYSELQQELKQALKLLNDLQRKCFILSRIHGLKYSDIADLLQISVRTVELKIAQAIQLLKKYLKTYLSMLVIYWLNILF